MYTEEQIVSILNTKPMAIERAILAIYNNQTPTEKSAGATLQDNGIGFSGADARMGTYMAQWFLKTGRPFSGKFKKRGKRMAHKYRKQLVMIANSKTKAKAAPKQSSIYIPSKPKQPSVAVETEKKFMQEALKEKVRQLPKTQMDLRFSNLELD